MAREPTRVAVRRVPRFDSRAAGHRRTSQASSAPDRTAEVCRCRARRVPPPTDSGIGSAFDRPDAGAGDDVGVPAEQLLQQGELVVRVGQRMVGVEGEFGPLLTESQPQVRPAPRTDPAAADADVSPNFSSHIPGCSYSSTMIWCLPSAPADRGDRHARGARATASRTPPTSRRRPPARAASG